jgi:hypothetical protein
MGDDAAIHAVDLESHLRTASKSDARLLDRIRRRTFAVPRPEGMREAGGEDQVILGAGNVSDSATERSFVGRAIVLSQPAPIIVVGP